MMRHQMNLYSERCMGGGGGRRGGREGGREGGRGREGEFEFSLP